MRRTKIICTIGPASDSQKILAQMVSAGMDMARLNLSHGTLSDQSKRIKTIRRISPETPILVDLQGPRIRTGLLKEKKICLVKNKFLTLTSKKVLGDENIISISPPSVIKDIKMSSAIFLQDGTIELKVIRKRGDSVFCKVLDGGELGENKGVNLPGTQLSLPSLTNKDKKDIAWAISQKVDFIALSFVRHPKDVLALKHILKAKKSNIPIIAKIEKPEAVANIKEIVRVSDLVMVARGDLGVEVDLENVPIIQKQIIKVCHSFEKPVIVATQMLESMVSDETPTRAEVSDVANAIFEGTNYIMTSEETSVGKYPVLAVKMMMRIIKTCEKAIVRN
ncbi:MAG: pyruvate kinase [Candidatus Saganbacteria bacterium]|nr:pyruvate kinase [Candidatus Saganbacteria bacterium]